MTVREPLSWGAAFPAVQAEGAGLASDWFAWERDGEAPPSFDGNGFSRFYADDLRLVRELGADGVRLTLDWSRVEPSEGNVDGAVVARYRDVLSAARDLGLRRWVVLVDGPLPGWFSIDERGWRDKRARNYFWPRHVERIGDAFADLVDGWLPIVRPVSYARAAFVTAAAPPGTRSIQRFVETVQGNYLASYGAWQVLRGSAPVALGVEGAPVRVAETGGERPARLYDTVQWAWAEGLRDGMVQLPRLPGQRVDAMRDAFEAVAFTFDGTYAVRPDGSVVRSAQEEDLLETLHRMAESAGERPLWIAGHTVSVGDAKADCEAAEVACRQLDAARRDGIDVPLWLWEPAVDGYEMAQGTAAKLGLFDEERHPKAAAEVVRRWAVGRDVEESDQPG